MKKFVIQIIALILVAFGGMYVFSNKEWMNLIAPNTFFSQQSQTKTKVEVKINDVILNIEIADTKAKREKGLGGRDSLASSSGMLFVFPQSQKQKFWMKGMKISLDLIYIQDGKIVDIIKNVPPPISSNVSDNQLPVYEPVMPVNMVLETNSGFSDANNIKVGDMVYMIKQ